jgi:hypothetical protein
LAAPPIICCIASGVPPRGRKLVVMKPPSGKPRTEFNPIGSGAMTQPTQVTTGIAGAVSTWNTSIDSRPPCPTTNNLCTGPLPGST